MLSFANPPTPNPLPGPFSTYDIERVYHCILTDSHCILLTGAPLENSILSHFCDFTSSMVHVLGRQPRWWSCLVYPGLPCSFLATLFIGCALFPRPPNVPTVYLEGVLGCFEGSQFAATDVDHHPAASPPRILVFTYPFI